MPAAVAVISTWPGVRYRFLAESGRGKRDAARRVRRQPSCLHRVVEDGGEHAVDLADGRRRGAVGDELRDPSLDGLVLDLGEGDVTPSGEDVVVERDGVTGAGGRLQVHLRLEPLLRERADGDACSCGVTNVPASFDASTVRNRSASTFRAKVCSAA
ncbi:hypothetical protein GCM10027265_27200 [Jatrophihabitans fulvus]